MKNPAAANSRGAFSSCLRPMDQARSTSSMSAVSRRSAGRLPVRLRQQIGRNSEQVVQRLDLGTRKLSLPIEEIRDAAPPTHDLREVASLHPTLLQHEVGGRLRGGG